MVSAHHIVSNIISISTVRICALSFQVRLPGRHSQGGVLNTIIIIILVWGAGGGAPTVPGDAATSGQLCFQSFLNFFS